jgi:hypothetical protein
MARDYTKYTIEGLAKNLNKRQLVFNVIKDYIEKNNPTLETLLSVFPDEIQGSKGVVKKEKDVDDAKRFNMKEPLKIKNGMHIVVSNQWGGDNIPNFIETTEKLGYIINMVNNDLSNENEQSTIKNIMKLKLFVEEKFTTTITREAFEIDTEDYPELQGMNEDEISDYIDNNVWDMAAIDRDVYSSLAEQLSQATPENEDVSDNETSFYIEVI